MDGDQESFSLLGIETDIGMQTIVEGFLKTILATCVQICKSPIVPVCLC